MGASSSGRIRSPLPACAALIAAAAGVIAASLPGLAASWRALGEGSAVVTAYPRDGIGLPLGVAFLAFAGVTLTPPPPGRRGGVRSHARAERRVDWAAAFMAVAAVALVSTALAPAATGAVLAARAHARSYRECPPPSANRYGALRWARSPEACPR